MSKMLIEQKMCENCNKKVRAEKPKLNHILHCILTVLTGGGWLGIYAILAILNSKKNFICMECGSEIK